MLHTSSICRTAIIPGKATYFSRLRRIGKYGLPQYCSLLNSVLVGKHCKEISSRQNGNIGKNVGGKADR